MITPNRLQVLISVYQNHKKAISKWIYSNKQEVIILAVILAIGAYLRLYHIGEYMTFLGDEGRDAIIVRRLLVDFDPILIGPGTSIGNMYLGPLYYYLMAPALLLANFSPAGPAVMIALLGIVTICLVWFITREWFPANRQGIAKDTGNTNYPALTVALLYAIAPTVVIYSRSSWNPNIMPFFSLVSIYSIWRVWQKKESKWLIVLGISFAFVLQSHYLGLLLLPTLLLFWYLSFRNIRKEKIQLKIFKKNTFIGGGVLAFLMSPLVIFDARHGWQNYSALKKFLLERQTTVSAKPWNALPKFWPLAQEFSTSLLAGRNEKVGSIVAIIFVICIIFVIFKRKSLPKIMSDAYLLLLVWLGFAFVGLGVYKQEIYDHYFGFFFAALFIATGGFATTLVGHFPKKGKVIAIIFFLGLFIVNIANGPLKNGPSRQMQRAMTVADKIINESNQDKFNLAVIAERNYEDGYQYFLERKKAKVIEIDAQKIDETITEQLFAVCELPLEKCQPVSNPKAQVANFGWSKIEAQWQLAGVTLYKLVHVSDNEQ